MRFRKKPIEIDAVEVASLLSDADHAWWKMPVWVRDAYERGDVLFRSDGILVLTREGQMFAKRGDWLLRGIKGELYPCDPDVFEQTYDKVEG